MSTNSKEFGAEEAVAELMTYSPDFPDQWDPVMVKACTDMAIAESYGREDYESILDTHPRERLLDTIQENTEKALQSVYDWIGGEIKPDESEKALLRELAVKHDKPIYVIIREHVIHEYIQEWQRKNGSRMSWD
jgi:putative heme degradation protein